MRAKEFITERASAILYHGTNSTSAINILHTKTFILVNARSDYMQRKLMIDEKYPYFMSTSRVKYGGYCVLRNRQINMNCNVMFVLDGNQINNKGYITRPVNADVVWGDKKSKIDPPVSDYDFYGDMMEDRIWSKTHEMPIDNIIIELHHYKDNEFTDAAEILAEQCQNMNIPYYAYDDATSYTIQNKRRSIDI